MTFYFFTQTIFNANNHPNLSKNLWAAQNCDEINCVFHLQMTSGADTELFSVALYYVIYVY